MSETILPKNVIDATRSVVTDLVAANYQALESSGVARRVRADDLRRVVAEYGRTLVLPPNEEAFSGLLQAMQIDGWPLRWAVLVDLWTADEGRSDLTLCMEASLVDEAVSVEITDLRVL
ncbi:MAG: hypothetical protein KIT58_14305 [Planctomycetota bacterium]|nr:hypothetical protein [Planctomycetota bacterium]